MPADQSARPRGRPPGSTNKTNKTNKSKGGTDEAALQARKNPTVSRPSLGSASSRINPRHDDPEQLDPFADSQDAMDTSTHEREHDVGEDEDEDDDEEPKKTIPPDLLTRLLHEAFEKDGTRISKGANEAVAKYMDVFVREAIARAAKEKRDRGFLDVEDLEKIAPQLLLDL